MWTVVEIGKKQYIAKKGDVLEVERLKNKGKIVFDKVLLLADGKNVSVGTPYLDKVKVKAEVKEEKKGKKVRVFKFKRRKKYQKEQGHRQIKTLLKISDIVAPKK
ncbi:MAG: 50S ribosomal protein L21 [Candidatus Omnitrophota bacterium]|nr:MAG: 50S ribosomal protein L21 [Candidatus Omnitrophota bacterium]